MARRKKFNNGKTIIIQNEQKSPKICNNKAKSVSNVEPSSPNQNKQLLLKLLKFYNNLVRLMLLDRKELKQIQNDYKWFDNDLEKFYQKIINNFANGMEKSDKSSSQKTWRNLKQTFLATFNNNDLKTIKKLPPKNNDAKNLNINQQMESEQRSKMKRMLKRKLDDDNDLQTKTEEKSWATSTDRPRRSCTLKKPEQPSKIIIKSKSKNVSAKIPPIISISSDDSDDETSSDDSDSDTTSSTSSTSDSSSSSSSSSDNDEENSKKNVEQLVVNCDPFNCMPSTSHNNNNHSNTNYQKSTLTNFLTILSPSPNTSLTTTTAAETNVTSSPNVLAMRIVDNQSNQQSSSSSLSINNNQRFNLMATGQKLPPLLNQNFKTAFLLPSSSSLSKPNQSFTGKVLLLNSKPILVQNGNEIQLPMIANNLHNSLSTVPVKNFQQPNDRKSLSSLLSSSTLNQSSTGKQPLQQPEIIKIEDDSDDDDNIEMPNKISKPNTALENCVQTKKQNEQKQQQPQQQNSNHESSSLKKSSSTFGKEQILHSTPNPQNNGQLANVPMQLLQNHGLVRPNRPTPAILRSTAINKIISKSLNPNLSPSSTPSSIVKQSNDPKIFHSHCQCDDWKTSKKAKKAEYMRRYRKNKKAQNQNTNSLVDQNILKNE
uniref:Mediator of RNA polymerase II transcription subunit 26 isoform X2 n=1 Tax=Dermatophagoides pteronyssinus TaxID=6956 RepID=A0A6P6XQM9_DERPT|nr:putative mediator of RNA polymerase II transcription subunit 26 isoform X2 [Dermatophagoides pteronyssinus]